MPIKSGKMDMEEIKMIIQETLNEEFAILRQKILECVEEVARKTFADLRASFEKSDEEVPLPTPENADAHQEEKAAGATVDLKAQQPPIFNPNTSPVSYLYRLKKYFLLNIIIDEHQKLMVAEQALSENAAGLKPLQYENFAAFEAAFLQAHQTEGAFTTNVFYEFYRSVDKKESLLDFGRRKYTQYKNFFPLSDFPKFLSKFQTLVPKYAADAIIKAAPNAPGRLNCILNNLNQGRNRFQQHQNRTHDNQHYHNWTTERDLRFRLQHRPNFRDRGVPHGRPDNPRIRVREDPTEFSHPHQRDDAAQNEEGKMTEGKILGSQDKSDVAGPENLETGPMVCANQTTADKE